MKEIYFAGGCFWGVEAYFKLIPGVKETRVGYANSLVLNPTYEEVCAEETGAVETTYVKYNPKVISLSKLLEFFFRIIDPTAINRQGNDYGTQYRSGIYYVLADDQKVIAEALHKLQQKYPKPIVVENKQLLNFYDAELYHQDYLLKNPHGYCHVNLNALAPHETKINKRRIYNSLLENVKHLFNEDSSPVSVLSNFTALIKDAFPAISWVGFYLNDGKKLVVGPFQGKVACETIAYDRGVCGAAYTAKNPIIVPDVHEFTGHIVCDELTNSEIVLPVYDAANTLIGVFDVDSHMYDYFDAEDETYLSELLQIIKKYIKRGKLL